MRLPSFAAHATPPTRPRHASAPARRFAFFGSGHAVGYADPKTLLPGPEKCKPTGGREGAAERSPAVESAGSGEGLLLGSLEEFQPTLMAGVPKVCGGRGADTGDRLGLFSDSSSGPVLQVWEAIKAGALAKAWQGGADGGLAVKVMTSWLCITEGEQGGPDCSLPDRARSQDEGTGDQAVPVHAPVQPAAQEVQADDRRAAAALRLGRRRSLFAGDGCV